MLVVRLVFGFVLIVMDWVFVELIELSMFCFVLMVCLVVSMMMRIMLIIISIVMVDVMGWECIDV